MDKAPVRGCTILMNFISDEVEGRRVVKEEWRPLVQLINGLYRMEPTRNWTYCLRGSQGKELFMHPVLKSRCESCRYAAR